MVYANNATITTPLSNCGPIVNVSRTVEDLYNLYQNNSRVFNNISIINFDCNTKYFEQIITFTQSVSIQIQIALASIYFDYIHVNGYSLNGFFIDREQRFNFSSISLNNSVQTSACLTGELAQDLLCPLNSSTPRCIESSSNPWIFNCSENLPTSTTITFSPTNTDEFIATTLSSILTPWKIGLICGLSIFFLLILFFLLGYFLRRYSRSKRVALSRENLFDNIKSFKSGVPQGQAFQRTKTIIEPKSLNKTPISWIYDATNTNYINIKPPGPYNQGTFIDHAKVYDPIYPSKPVKVPPSRSGTPLKISEDEFKSTFDESLHDEDAWMSILAVANAELDVLNQLENEQNQVQRIT